MRHLYLWKLWYRDKIETTISVTLSIADTKELWAVDFLFRFDTQEDTTCMNYWGVWCEIAVDGKLVDENKRGKLRENTTPAWSNPITNYCGTYTNSSIDRIIAVIRTSASAWSQPIEVRGREYKFNRPKSTEKKRFVRNRNVCKKYIVVARNYCVANSCAYRNYTFSRQCGVCQVLTGRQTRAWPYKGVNWRLYLGSEARCRNIVGALNLSSWRRKNLIDCTIYGPKFA